MCSKFGSAVVTRSATFRCPAPMEVDTCRPISVSIGIRHPRLELEVFGRLENDQPKTPSVYAEIRTCRGVSPLESRPGMKFRYRKSSMKKPLPSPVAVGRSWVGAIDFVHLSADAESASPPRMAFTSRAESKALIALTSDEICMETPDLFVRQGSMNLNITNILAERYSSHSVPPKWRRDNLRFGKSQCRPTPIPF